MGIQRKRRSEFTLAYEARRWVDVLAILKKKSQPDEHGCWVWIRKPLSNGYAQIRIPGRRMYAHRVAVEAKLGTRISPNMPVHHKCANRRCINPDHLELVTHAQNVAEMLARQALLAEISRLRALLDGAGIAHGSPDLTDVPQSHAVTTRKAY
ncbi:HNH endonuclease signature motif containing protein [Williamsia serinedens]|uniref:HNH endonuclease signature motif containing protein n=1 Tax=Williamsia serinedens TaxID=391736 RepID=UPI0020A5F6FC|nr:HNH endonuclease signature motif containing protein [Williamsia serinedens]